MSPFLKLAGGGGDYHDWPQKSWAVQVLSSLLRYYCFDLIALQESDHSIAAVPDAVSGAPDLVSIDLAAAGQHDYGFAALSFSDSGSTC